MRFRKTLIALAVVACVLALAVAAAFARGPLTTLNELETLTWPHHFTPAAWQSHPSQRWQMASDAFEHHLLLGRSEAWLRQSLGTPARDERFSAGRVLSWDAPAPQRPGDELIVVVRDGVVSGVYLTADLMNVPENN